MTLTAYNSDFDYNAHVWLNCHIDAHSNSMGESMVIAISYVNMMMSANRANTGHCVDVSFISTKVKDNRVIISGYFVCELMCCWMPVGCVFGLA